MNVNQLLDLMGTVVSFDYEILQGSDQTNSVKGLVRAVIIDLDNKHSILVRDFNDYDEYYEISRMKNFKAVHLDPYAFFENIKNGSITVDI